MQTKHLIALFVLGAIWGASFMFMRIAAPELGVVFLVFVRTLLAAIVLMPFVIMRRAWVDIKKFWKPITFVGLINTALPFAMFNYSSLHLQAGINAILNATAPMFAALIAFIWLKETLTKTMILGLGIGFAGVVIISLQKNDASQISIIPVLSVLGATCCYGAAANYIKKSLTQCKPIALAAGSQLSASVLLIIPALLQMPLSAPSEAAVISALLLAVLGTGIAYILYFYLIANIGPAKAITVGYLVPLFGIIWGIVLLNERLSWTEFFGGACILFGVVLTTGLLNRKTQ